MGGTRGGEAIIEGRGITIIRRAPGSFLGPRSFLARRGILTQLTRIITRPLR